MKGKNNSYHSYLKLVSLTHFLRNKEKKVAEINKYTTKVVKDSRNVKRIRNFTSKYNICIS